VASDVVVISAGRVDVADERVTASGVRYRFVIGTATLR
jgi:hypothetical protein